MLRTEEFCHHLWKGEKLHNWDLTSDSFRNQFRAFLLATGDLSQLLMFRSAKFCLNRKATSCQMTFLDWITNQKNYNVGFQKLGTSSRFNKAQFQELSGGASFESFPIKSTQASPKGNTYITRLTSAGMSTLLRFRNTMLHSQWDLKAATLNLWNSWNSTPI